MLDRFNFWLTKIYVFGFVIIRNICGKPWCFVHGVKLPLEINIGFNTLRWIINGEYEKGEIHLIKKRIVKSDIILEIGTGLGFVSAYCARIVGDNNVFSFEANPLNFNTALKVYSLNNVKPILQNAMLSQTEGVIDFPVNRKSLLASSLLKSTNDLIIVPQLELNKIIEQIQPSFLIMDIEGAEYDIFRIINFQTIQKIQVELHPAILGDEKIHEIFNCLSGKGFVIDLSFDDGRNYFFKRLPV